MKSNNSRSGKFDSIKKKPTESKKNSKAVKNIKSLNKNKKGYTTSSKPYKSFTKDKKKPLLKESDGAIRLNRYIANAGICSRREADKLIEAGVIKVNGKIITQLGTKVFPGDKVMYGDQTLNAEKPVYILLNKPKDYITTADDPQGRKTVMDLVKNATRERIYPVGRLDRNTTGLLLFTNDGELATKLTHPKNNIKKIYHVVTDKNVTKEDLQKLKQGIELEDGFIKVDDVQFVGDSRNKRDIGVEIHSGKNRIVRRMFEHLGYKIIKLDRVMFAGLTKKDLPRGKYRMLSQQEINFLKMI